MSSIYHGSHDSKTAVRQDSIQIVTHTDSDANIVLCQDISHGINPILRYRCVSKPHVLSVDVKFSRFPRSLHGFPF
jgi:hypothetical protein